MDLDDEVCLCFHVTRRKLLAHVRTAKPRVASQMSACGGAGTGCGWCVPYLVKLYERGVEEMDGLSADEYARRRAVYRSADGS